MDPEAYLKWSGDQHLLLATADPAALARAAHLPVDLVCSLQGQSRIIGQKYLDNKARALPKRANP